MRAYVNPLFLVLLLAALPAAAEFRECQISRRQINALDLDEAAERLMEVNWIPDPHCTRTKDALVESLDRRLATESETQTLDIEERLTLRLMVDTHLLRSALPKRDLDTIEDRLASMENSILELATLDAPGVPEGGDPVDDEHIELLHRVRQIRSIVNGETPPPAPIPLPARPDWEIHFGFCGTPALMFYTQATALPDPADAWLALGRADIAIAQILQQQWVDALSYGMPPPKLRQFATAWFGEAGYSAELEAGIAAIRIEQGATGRTAYVPLFGHWLPLPLSIHSYDGAVQDLSEPDALANWLRELMAPPSESE